MLEDQLAALRNSPKNALSPQKSGRKPPIPNSPQKNYNHRNNGNMGHNQQN